MNPIDTTSSAHVADGALFSRFMLTMPLPDYGRDILTTAYHEAGHALVFALIGVPVASAEVSAAGEGLMVFDDAVLGRRSSKVDVSAIEGSLLWKDMVLLYATGFYAGMQAELLLHRYYLHGYLSVNAHDHQHASDLLHDAFGDDAPLFEAQQLTRAILRRHWPGVQTLALQLNARGSITPVDIAQVLPNGLPKSSDLLALAPPRYQVFREERIREYEDARHGGAPKTAGDTLPVFNEARH